MLQKSVEDIQFDFIRLDSSKSVEKFDCGDKDLNDFILNHAAAFQKHLCITT